MVNKHARGEKAQMRTTMKCGLLMAAMALMMSPAPVLASGLRTPFGEVIVRNLKIGQTYSMHKLLNLPMRVINTGDENVDLRIETIHATALNAGYEEIPSLDWVRVETGTFTVRPNREAVTDLIVTIPNDPALLGRRFQADIWSHTVDPRAILVGLGSRLLMHIDSTPPTEEELKKKYVDETLANLDFTVFPVNAAVSDVPLGRMVDLRKEHKIAIKLINPNERALNFRVRSIPVWESMITVPDGFQAAEDPQWLKPEKDVVKAGASSITEMSLRLSLPDRPDLRGRHLYFIVSFEVLEQKIPTRVYYRLAVDTANAAKAAVPAGK